MQKIRVLVANRPRLMKDLVLATIGDQPDIEVVGETQNEAEITELVERTRPDYLIIALENPEVRPGLSGFLMTGQWVMPGGGLPSGMLTAKPAVKAMCKADHVPFEVHAGAELHEPVGV